MTREEAIRLIKDHIDVYVVCHGEEDRVAVSIDNVDVEAFDMAIKALEQELVLDKIRAEITDWQTDIHDNEYDAETHDFVFERIYEIIDEYKNGG